MAYSEDRSLGNYERFSEAGNLATTLGDSRGASMASRRVNRILSKHPGLDVSGVDVQQFPDWQSLGGAGADNAIAGLRKLNLPRFEASGDRDMAANRWDIKTNQALERQMKEGLTREIDPSLRQAETRADAMAGTAAISAGDEQAMRSRVAAMVRSAESTRMARIGSQLGYGNNGASPAAAALAAQAAEEADQTITSSLRDMGLQINETNRQQARQDIDLATRVAEARFRLNNGDSKSLIGMRGEVGQMLDALYSRDQTMKMQEKQIHDAGQQSTADRINTYLGYAQGVAGIVGNFYGGSMNSTPQDSGGGDMSDLEWMQSGGGNQSNYRPGSVGYGS